MFWTVLLLLFLGIVLLFLEVLLPYGISFAVGVAIMALAVVLMFRHDPQSGAMLLVLALPTAGAAAWWVFRSGIKLAVLPPPAAGQPGAPSDAPPDGEIVAVCQTLRPTGAILWDRRRLPARNLQPEQEIPVGRHVRVAGRDSIFLLVEPAPESDPDSAPSG
jgi:membrane-bound ClpP family serine protease